MGPTDSNTKTIFKMDPHLGQIDIIIAVYPGPPVYPDQKHPERRGEVGHIDSNTKTILKVDSHLGQIDSMVVVYSCGSHGLEYKDHFNVDPHLGQIDLMIAVYPGPAVYPLQKHPENTPA